MPHMLPTLADTARILVADDQSDLVDALRLLLKPEGIAVFAVHSPDAALAAVGATAFDLVLMDLNYTGDTTSGREGIDLVAQLQAVDASLPVVVMTGWDRSTLRSKRCGAASATSCRSLGTTPRSSRCCAPRSRPGASG